MYIIALLWQQIKCSKWNIQHNNNFGGNINFQCWYIISSVLYIWVRMYNAYTNTIFDGIPLHSINGNNYNIYYYNILSWRMKKCIIVRPLGIIYHSSIISRHFRITYLYVLCLQMSWYLWVNIKIWYIFETFFSCSIVFYSQMLPIYLV